MKSKKGKLQKCPVCLHQFKEENLDKHMHSRSHHEAIERLKGGQEMHRCWACDMYVPGLKEYEKHIATLKHIKNMGLLQQKRCRGNGFKVDYTDDELTAICAKRDQKRQALKLEKKKEKLKRRKARKASLSKKQLNRNSQVEKIQINNNVTIVNDHQSGNQCVAPTHDVRFRSNNDQRPRPILAQEPEANEPALEANMFKSDQVVGWNSFSWQQSSFRNLKGDVDFTSDLLAPSQGIFFSFQEGDKTSSQQSSSGVSRQKIKTQAAFQKKSQKRFLDADPSDSPHVKRPYLTDVPSVNLKPDMYGRYSSFSEGAESERVSQGTSLDIPAPSLHSPGLVHGQVDACLSLMGNSVEKDQGLFIHSEDRDVNKSTEEPKLKPVVNKRLNKSKENSPKLSVTPRKLKNTGKLEAKIKRKLSLLMKPSGRSSPAASSSDVLKENKADQKEEQEPAHSQRSLTALLSRSVSKTEARKPNLNMARRIRPSQRPVKSEHDSRLLKPALQKVISSKGWRKIYQEAAKKKLQRDKYLPRFGIELVNPLPPEPLELVLEEVEDFAEGFQWKSINPDDITLSFSREKTFSSQPGEAPPVPSIEEHDGDASNLTSQPLQCTSMKSKKMKRAARRNDDALGTHRSSHAKVAKGVGRKDALTADPSSETQRGIMPGASLFHGRAEKLDDFGAEQFQSNDEHIQQEMRGASNKSIGNVEISKRKVSKLLAVFQREDELNICLEDVNNQLLLHHAALQAAFRNVQYLLEVKQQITAQMSSLRTERIAILQRIQNSRSSSADFPIPASESQQVAPGTSRQQQDRVPNHSV